MSQRILLIAADLGTSSTTTSYVRLQESFDATGKVNREKRGGIIDIRDWPGGLEGDAIGKVCVPTELVYSRDSHQLLFWGFEAQDYLDDASPEIQPDQVYVVEHIKLLLADPEEARTPTAASARYRIERDMLKEILGMHPYEVFEDFLTKITEHVIGSANGHYNDGIDYDRVELVLAFPSGWPEYVHTKVAEVGARALRKAFVSHNLNNVLFGIESVYTVSETLCGVKEWLRNAIAEADFSVDVGILKTNLDELNEGDCCLPIDLGGGTGCMTPLRLVTKNPLRVDQLGPTKSLEVSGEAVEAEFKQWLQPMFANEQYLGDVSQVINRICRRFREAKKNCGLPLRPGSSTWNVPVPRLKAKKAKGFEKDCMKIDRKLLDKCFDPILDTLESAIHQMLHKVPQIKAIVFLGQFGGRSGYLRKRLAKSDFGNVKLRYSQSGKLDVVKGALEERLTISSSFVRKWVTAKSYGTLVVLPYYPGSEAQNMFPNAVHDGAVSFEHDIDGDNWLKMVQWAIPKGTVVEKSHTCDIGQDAPLHHTWPDRKDVDIQFEDTIIISDEFPPATQRNGRSYTLWTEAHQQNRLIINNRRMYIQQIPFSWDLAMSQKLDSTGCLIGSYEKDDLEDYVFPEKVRRGRRKRHLKKLYYHLLWDITEMQLKVHIKALFPNPAGPLTTQLAKERRIEESEKVYAGESRSTALIRDIEIVTAADLEVSNDGADHRESGFTRGRLSTVDESASNQLLDEQAGDFRRSVPAQSSLMASPTGGGSQAGWDRVNDAFSTSPRDELRPAEASASTTSKSDGRRREGCFTCKIRKKKCDCNYTFDKTRGSSSCNACSRFEIQCYMTEPVWAGDPEQRKREQLKLKELVKLGKRKTRDESCSSSNSARDRPNILNAFNSSSESSD